MHVHDRKIVYQNILTNTFCWCLFLIWGIFTLLQYIRNIDTLYLKGKLKSALFLSLVIKAIWKTMEIYIMRSVVSHC